MRRPTCEELLELGAIPAPGVATTCCAAELEHFAAALGTARGRALPLQCRDCDGYGERWVDDDALAPPWGRARWARATLGACPWCRGYGTRDRLYREDPL